MAIVQLEVPYKKGYDFGAGADLASGSPVGKVVGGAFSGVDDDDPGDNDFRATALTFGDNIRRHIRFLSSRAGNTRQYQEVQNV